MAPRVILHVDMDAFFASVEQREQPKYQGRPVVVGADPQQGSGRGVVAACSYEAREFGIHSALPISRAFRLCPQAVYLRPNAALYHRVSREVISILRRFTDLVEPVSIDEAFLDVTGSRRLFGSGSQIAAQIKELVRREQQLTCSIGVACNKFLAKIASDLKKPNGLCVVESGTEKSFLRPLSVRTIWGVGKNTEKQLLRLGIRTIGDVAARGSSYWEELMGSRGRHLWELSQGLDSRPVQVSRGSKSLSHEFTFSRDCDDPEEIRKLLLYLCEEVARRARRNGTLGRRVTLKWRHRNFTTLTRQRTRSQATDDSQTLFAEVERLMEEFLPLKQKVRLVGVGLGHFENPGAGQQRLFSQSEAKKSKLDASVDAITEKFGKNSIRKARLLNRRPDKRSSSFVED